MLFWSLSRRASRRRGDTGISIDISKDGSSSLWEENGFCGEDDACNGSQRLSRSLPRGQDRCYALRCEAPLTAVSGWPQ